MTARPGRTFTPEQYAALRCEDAKRDADRRRRRIWRERKDIPDDEDPAVIEAKLDRLDAERRSKWRGLSRSR